MAIIIDGNSLSKEVLDKLKIQIDKIDKKLGLKVITVGNDEASKIYINNKKKICEKLNINFYTTKFDENVREDLIIQEIEKSNADDSIDGILVQLPLPSKFDQIKIISHILPQKDVDGFHPENIGNLILKKNCIKPCTALGVVEILKKYNINIEGADVLILGRSNIVGKPLMNMLLNMDATVQICHTKTKNIEKKLENADIIITATGQHNIIGKNQKFKKNVCIIDVGINRINGKICGDVDFYNLSQNEDVGYITPVPGGVGPMTIAFLINNLIDCYKNGIIKK